MNAAFREALVAILDEAPSVVAITGQPADNCLAWSNIGDLKDRGILFFVGGAAQTGGDNDTRDVRVQFSCFGLVQDEAERLADAVETLVTSNALWAEGVNAAPMLYDRREASELEDPARKRRRVDVDIVFNAIKP